MTKIIKIEFAVICDETDDKKIENYALDLKLVY